MIGANGGGCFGVVFVAYVTMSVSVFLVFTGSSQTCSNALRKGPAVGSCCKWGYWRSMPIQRVLAVAMWMRKHKKQVALYE